jgi:glutamate-1-semialdehyde 2,1-aminomutase
LNHAIEMGFFLNFETQYHAELAELICEMVPCAEKVRLCNSGTEATLSAVRLARAHTGKAKILKFEGHFHGMHEFVFYNWHSHLGERNEVGEIKPVQDTSGIPAAMDDLIIVIPYNDYELFESTIHRHKHEIAAVILEPVLYNAGCIESDREFLEKVRALTEEEGIVLMFDEVLSGFRMAKGGAQEYYGVTPDLSTLAKALGCGMTIAALVGKNQVMRHLNPEGKVIMSGTYTGSLINVLGALAALKVLNVPGFYDEMNKKADYFYGRFNRLFEQAGVSGRLQGLGARFGLYFGCKDPIRDFRDAAGCYHLAAGKRFIQLAVENNLYFHDYGDSIVPMHCGFTAVHTTEDFDETLERIEKIFAQMKREGF